MLIINNLGHINEISINNYVYINEMISIITINNDEISINNNNSQENSINNTNSEEINNN